MTALGGWMFASTYTVTLVRLIIDRSMAQGSMLCLVTTYDIASCTHAAIRAENAYRGFYFCVWTWVHIYTCLSKKKIKKTDLMK